MKMMVCLDGSERSEAILEPARSLARENAWEVRLVHVIDPDQVHEVVRGKMTASRRNTGDWSGGTLPGAGGGLRPIKHLQQTNTVIDRNRAFESAAAAAEDYLRSVADGFPAGTQSVVLYAHHPADAIVDDARKEQVDMIAMATRSRSGFATLLGSTTNAVVRSGVAPVLVLHPTAS